VERLQRRLHAGSWCCLVYALTSLPACLTRPPTCLCVCRAMAELLMAAVSRGVQAAEEAQRAQGSQAAVDLAPLPALPPPMVTENYEANATSCHLQVSVCCMHAALHVMPCCACCGSCSRRAVGLQ